MNRKQFTENQLIAHAFQQAKKCLAQTRNEWIEVDKELLICHAIEKAVSHEGQMLARNVIRHRLGDCSILDSWLVEHVDDARTLFWRNREEFNDEVQKYRHRWLDSLIAEFSQEE